MIIDIIGAGSLGLLYAGGLAASGQQVRLWCRGQEQAEAVRVGGITVHSSGGAEAQRVPAGRIEAAEAERYAEKARRQPGDWLLLAVKQQAVEPLLPLLAEASGGGPLRIVCLQNGSGHLERLHEALPEASLYAAITTEGAKRSDTAEVVRSGRGVTTIGRWRSTEEKDRFAAAASAGADNDPARSLAEVLEAAGFSVILSNEVDTIIYRKLLINAVINPLTAIWRIPNGELLADARRVSLMKELFDEAAAVYAASGIPVSLADWDGILRVCESTSANVSSMLADIQAGRPTEIRWINGRIIELAQSAGVEVPAHRMICRLVEGMKT